MRGETAVAVVGLGSRGLSVLERVVTLAKLAGPVAGRVRVEVIDPRCDGAGVHDTEQPDYLLLNTTCSQVSMFPDAFTVGEAVDVSGPSLYEWVTARGLRMAADGFTVGEAGREIRPHEFLPRRVLGEYLGWFLDEVLRRAPSYVRVTLHRAEAVDMSTAPNGGLSILLSGGRSVDVDYAFLTTGYTSNSDHARSVERLIPSPYPLPSVVADIGPGESVAVGGFGLSAMDLMSALTVGRGGEFVDGTYRPSGREPRLLFFSRSGAPCRARPQVVEFGPPYRPLVFTPAAIDRLRAARGGALDFDADVLPLVLTEMRIAYRRCEAALAGPDALADLESALGAPGAAAVEDVLDRLDTRLGPFDAAAAFDGATDILLDDRDAYRKWLAEVVRRDLADGLLGFTGSPVKAGLDILRSLRDMFRYVVDFGGLTGSSLDRFLGHTVPAVNRAVVGPQYERHTELLTLMAAGVADAPFGPDPTATWSSGRWTVASSQLGVPYSEDVDWLVSAHVALPAVDSSASPVLTALQHKGWIRRHPPASRQVPGIDVNADQHPLRADGRPERRLWVLGPLCEGSTFYNNLVPSPRMYSRPIFDAHRCVTTMYADAGIPVPSTGPAEQPCHPIYRQP
jgi:uncharacterized NAD(P)/FAD-binding protein YdhS